MFEDKDFKMGVMCDFWFFNVFLLLLYFEEIFERCDEIIFYLLVYGDWLYWYVLEYCELVFDYII